MKKFLPLAIFALFTLTTHTNLFAQASCVTIVNNTFRIVTNQANPCLKSISFDFINPSNGNKRIRLEVLINNINVITNCVDASGQKDVQRNYTSPAFTLCNLSALEVIITPINGNDCNNAGCAPFIRSIGGAPLPVVFSSFTASRNNSAVTLKWETATEINNAGFTIERNISGNWEQVTFVPTQAAGGNSTGKLSYQYTDFNTAKGISQYRIRQTDVDGQFKYSEVRAIRGNEQEAGTTVFPNPSVDGKVTVLFANAAVRDVMLFDMAGRTVKQWNGFNANSLSISGLTPGMYTVRSINKETNEQQVQKLIVSGR